MLRIGSAAVLIALVLVTIWVLPPVATLVLATVAAALAGAELAAMASRGGASLPATFVAAAAAIVMLAFFTDARAAFGDAPVLGVTLAALLLAAGAVTLTLGPPDASTLARAAALVMVPVYVGVPLGAIAWIQSVAGPGATTWLVAVVAVSDSAQYYTGRAFGRTRLAPTVSPAKTREGAVGGVLGAVVIGSLLAQLWLPGVPMALGAATAGALALAGIVGDLFESLLKRGVGVKDSSHLIPGHGGVLDRIDSHLFAAPVFYVLLRYALAGPLGLSGMGMP